MTTFPSATDYQSAVLNPKLVFQDKDLCSAKVTTDQLGLPAVTAGGFALTYFFETSDGAKWVVRCFKKEIESRKQRYIKISQFLDTHKEPFFTTAKYLEQEILVNGQRYPIVKMPQIEGETLNKFIESNLGRPQKLINLTKKFRDLVARLEQLGIAHGDLQHGNIMVSNEQLVLIDYDGMYIPELKGYQSVEAGHRSYQHPLRKAEFWPDLDRFSTIVTYLGLKATGINPNLWQKYSNGDNLLFQSTDFANPFASPLLHELESLPGLKQHVMNFRISCKLPLLSIPSLFDFLNGNIPQEPILVAKDGDPPPTSPYTIIDATKRLVLLGLVGEVVQVVGKITDGKSGVTVNGSPFLLLNFGKYQDGCMTLVIWSEALQLFSQQKKDPKSYIGKLVSVTGRLSSYTGKGKLAQPQITIDLPTQIKILFGPDEVEPQLEITPDYIDFGDITNGQDKEQWVTLKNVGGGVLKSQIQSYPSWLNVSAHDVQCSVNSTVKIKIRTATQNISPKALSHNLSIVSNGGNKTIQIRAKVIHAPVLWVTPTVLDFGSLPFDQGKELWFNIKNIGTGILRSQVSNSPSWLVVEPSLAYCPTGCTMKIKVRLIAKQTFALPIQQFGNFEAYQLLSSKLSISSNGGVQAVEVTAKVETSPPKPLLVPILQVTPSIVDFGELTIGQDKVQWLNIKNIGTGKLEIRLQNCPAWLEVTPDKTSCTSMAETVKVRLVANFSSLTQGHQSYSTGGNSVLSHKLSITSNGGSQIVEVQARLMTVKPTPPSNQPTTSLVSRILKALLISAFIFLLFSIVMIGLPNLSNRLNKALTPFIFDTTKPLAEENLTVPLQINPVVDDNKAVRVLSAPTAITPTPQPLNAAIITPITVTRTPTITAAAFPTSEHLTYTTALAQFFCRLGMCEGKEAYIQNNTGITPVTSVNPIKVDLTITDANVLSATILPISRIPITATTPPASPTSQSSCRSKNPITLLSPIDTTSNGAITFSWQWHGKLPKDCGFEVRVWRDGEPPKGVHDAVKDNLNGEIRRNSPNTYSLHVSNMQDTPSVQGHSGEYFWTVILVKLRPTYEETDLQAKPQRFWFRSSSD